ncbi:MAG: Tetratricopeptide domain protein [Ignavibacteria bacterium]|nr:MAG: Tetratricopeptide domain protein [Ignavibacteria bacterium]KAF0161746.1 MAG: Tetratricopeptide domain protein [Ignavibacteria bacterium]
MLEAKKKISKKELKEDKLVTSYYKFQNFFMESQAKILIGFGVIAVIVVAYILYTNKVKNDNQAASAMVAKVIPLLETGAYQVAVDGVPAQNITGLKKIVDDYGNTEEGELAKILLANAYIITGKSEEALNLYDDYSGSNTLLKASALAGKAGILESKKEYEEALGLYQKAAIIDETNPSNPEFLLKAGIANLKLGNKKEAKVLFETIKKDYTTAVPYMELEKYLVQTEN